MYSPPNASLAYHVDLINYLSTLQDCGSLVILGDLNVPDVNWNSLSASSSFSTSLCDLVFNLNLSQLVAVPTHVKGGVLDLVLTKAK